MSKESDSRPFTRLFRQMMATFHDHRKEQLLRSYCLQSKAEQRGRLDTIISLSAELARIRDVSRFATGFGESAIEAVLEGDWALAGELAQDLSFNGEPEAILVKYAPLWDNFRCILTAAVEEAQTRATTDTSGQN